MDRAVVPTEQCVRMNTGKKVITVLDAKSKMRGVVRGNAATRNCGVVLRSIGLELPVAACRLLKLQRLLVTLTRQDGIALHTFYRPLFSSFLIQYLHA